MIPRLNRVQDGRDRQWGIYQKQTGADRLSIGGALSCNAHGRGLNLKPIVQQVEEFDLVDHAGDVRTCSRIERPELFRLAIGGYGLFGIITRVRLDLRPARESAACRRARRDREHHGAPGGSHPRRLSVRRLSVHVTEIYVPRPRLAVFMEDARVALSASGANAIYGTVRLIERDDETFLAWARDRCACVIFNLHVEHTPKAIDAAAAFRELIDLGIRHGGSYYLTYHRWARKDQVARCYPQMREFLTKKREYDPDDVFQSTWYRHYKAMFMPFISYAENGTSGAHG